MNYNFTYEEVMNWPVNHIALWAAHFKLQDKKR